MQKNKGFNLFELIAIIIVTALVSIIATGVIMLKGSSKENITLVNKDENLQEFINVYNTILTKYYDKNIDKDGLLSAAEQGMLSFLGDKYTTYLDDAEYGEILDELSDSYEGVGIGINGNIVVTVTPDSPAEKAGIKIGDIITRIDGVEVDGTSQAMIKNYIKNEDVKTVKLEITRNEEVFTFKLQKEKLENVVINSKIIDGTKTGYIYISRFSISLDEQVRKALKSLESEGINNLIIDVRDNVGGYLTAAEKTLSLFLEEGKKIYTLETNDNSVDYKDVTKEKRNYNIVVLINNNTASAAEIMAATLKESYGATLVGTQSYGKGKVQEVSDLGNGDSVKMTTAKWLTPNGTCIDGVGIVPDYIVAETSAQLDKALEILNGNQF